MQPGLQLGGSWEPWDGRDQGSPYGTQYTGPPFS